MKVTVDLDSAGEDALQHHLDTGYAVQSYVRAALKFFAHARAREKEGNIVGFGSKDRFKTYNTEMSTSHYLGGEE